MRIDSRLGSMKKLLYFTKDSRPITRSLQKESPYMVWGTALSGKEIETTITENTQVRETQQQKGKEIHENTQLL